MKLKTLYTTVELIVGPPVLTRSRTTRTYCWKMGCLKERRGDEVKVETVETSSTEEKVHDTDCPSTCDANPRKPPGPYMCLEGSDHKWTALRLQPHYNVLVLKSIAAAWQVVSMRSVWVCAAHRCTTWMCVYLWMSKLYSALSDHEY